MSHFGAQCGARVHTGAYKADELVYQLLFIETVKNCQPLQGEDLQADEHEMNICIMDICLFVY